LKFARKKNNGQTQKTRVWVRGGGGDVETRKYRIRDQERSRKTSRRRCGVCDRENNREKKCSGGRRRGSKNGCRKKRVESGTEEKKEPGGKMSVRRDRPRKRGINRGRRGKKKKKKLNKKTRTTIRRGKEERCVDRTRR